MSGASWAVRRPGIVEGRFTDANEFLRALDPSSALWGDNADAWIFRGHADAGWDLVPKAHRAEAWAELAGLGEMPFMPSTAREGVRLSREEAVLKAFRAALDASGINVPFDYNLRGNINGLSSDKLIALAQHYGLPTRLLDWTRQSPIAAYFACLRPSAPARDLAVWALNTAFVHEQISDSSCQVIQTTRSDNPNLHAQDGVFTAAGLPAGAGLDHTDLPRIDEILSGHAAATAQPIMRKFVLARDHDEKLMRCLHQRRVTAGRLFPGIAGAALTVREQLQFGVKDRRF